MNKEVFDILSQDKNKRIQTVNINKRYKTNATNIHEYVKNNSKRIDQSELDSIRINKSAIKKGAAALATTAILLGSMTACGRGGNNQTTSTTRYREKDLYPDEILQPFNSPETRPVEVIEETGITVDDVLARYDELATKIAKATIACNENVKDTFADEMDNVDGVFYAITPKLYPLDLGYSYKAPIYASFSDQVLSAYWNYIPDSEYYRERTRVFDQDEIYKVTFEFGDNTMDLSHHFTTDFGIPVKQFDEILSGLNIQKTMIDKEALEAAGAAPNFLSELYQSDLFGKEAYSGTPITRKMILSINPETHQDLLWSLYNLADDMEKLNFEYKLPKSNTENQMQ